MAKVQASQEEVRAQLLERYQQLPAFAQELMQLVSVIYAPVARTQVVACLNIYLRHGGQRRKYHLAELSPHLAQLTSYDLLVMDGRQGLRCNPLVVEMITREALRQGTFEPLAKAVQAQLPIPTINWKRNQRSFQSDDQFLREVRIGLYQADWDYIADQFEAYYNHVFATSRISMAQVFEDICNNPFDRDWFLTLKKDIELYESALGQICLNSMLRLVPAEQAFNLLEADCQGKDTLASNQLRSIWIQQLLMRGRLAEAESAIKGLAQDAPEEALLLQGWLSCLQGDYAQTCEVGQEALKLLRKATGKRKVYFDNIPGIFPVLALLQAGDTASLRTAEDYAHPIAEQAYHHSLGVTYGSLERVAQVLQGNTQAKAYLLNTPLSTLANAHSFEALIDALCLYWADLDKARTHLPEAVKDIYKDAKAAGYHWFALEASTLLARLNPRSLYGKEAPALQEATGIQPITEIITPKEPWELALTALIGLNPSQGKGETATVETEYRLAWFLSLHGTTHWALQPKEQKISVKGGWSRGRAIALHRLKYELTKFTYLTPQDRQICACLTAEYRAYGGNTYYFQDRALLALAGHPLVFWEDSPTTPIEIVTGEPSLTVQQGNNGMLTLSLTPPLEEQKSVALVKETPARLKVVEFTKDHQRIAAVLGPKNALEVPDSAKEKVLETLNAIVSLVTVHSDIGGGITNAEEVPAQAIPHIHLLPAGSGLKVALLTRPFGDHGPYYRPGSGGEMVLAEVEGKRLQTHRDLKAEQQQALAVEKACPTLQRLEDEAGEWLVDDPEDCLELLMEVQELGDQGVVEWPEGEKMRIVNRVGLGDFKVQIERQRDWFAASGELPISDDQVLDMQRLMALLEASPGRFIKLADGEFIALTQEFRKRLEDLRAFSENSGKGVRFHPLASLAMEDWMDEVGQLKADKHWKDHVKRLKEAQDLKPELPSTLQAELRDYQVDGFNWLARLAHWGVGACLADDMGLGKTLQALAVILTRAPEGPTLIVAPTSVCMNWLSEAEKFAPTLNPMPFGSGDRQKVLDDLQPFDLLVCSYGLLQQEEVAKMLAEVQWQTIVLDEAQAIKNAATKRSQAAMKLQGGFKVLTTGTPIENHLGELWNLFRFINPGLLGSQDQFNQRFANAIERNQDKQARNRLKKLIQPFILRRTKTQVLEELPARTEVTLQVELSIQEMAFYEALRREAIAKLSEPGAEGGAKHLQVLAEIMKLRRACCNTRLVNAEPKLPSAKLDAFGEIVEELLENHHKALVFSQFVDHLAILKEFLDQKKVHYQYLDGSTPAKERKKRVDAFQSGQGDVFLISLKAGGTGLNLTAADYVIHMDPWWNPAVEDQASDRAHRMGQQRPVTIYRLVAKNTIEEKIVDLHQQKRDLADSLLEGTDMSGKISTDDLLRLISEG